MAGLLPRTGVRQVPVSLPHTHDACRAGRCACSRRSPNYAHDALAWAFARLIEECCETIVLLLEKVLTGSSLHIFNISIQSSASFCEWAGTQPPFASALSCLRGMYADTKYVVRQIRQTDL